MAPTRLFDDIDRTDRTHMRRAESQFDFLNRSATDHYGYVREFLEEWLSHVPHPERLDLTKRLRGDDDQHLAAFWELYLHEGYRRSGFEVTIHPTQPGESRHPDFLLDNGTDRFYVEAVSVGRSKSDVGEDLRLRTVYEVLEEFEVSDFSLAMEHFGVGPNPLPTRPLRKAISRWLGELDPAALAAADSDPEQRFEALPELPWSRDGWSIVLTAIPLRPSARGIPRPALGMTGPGEASLVANYRAVGRMLEKKYGRYGTLDAPLVIAVQSNTDYPTRVDEVERALFGASLRRPNDPDAHDGLLEDGFWLTRSGWRRDDCPQVITVADLWPSRVTRTAPDLWSTCQPKTATPTQPNWIVPVHIGAHHAEAGAWPDPAGHFGLDANVLDGRPDFVDSF